MRKSPVTKACTMTAEATSISAVTAWNSPMPPSTSDRCPRRAPAIEAANAPLASTKVVNRRKVPRLGMGDLGERLEPLVAGHGRFRRFVLRRTLGHHAVRLDLKALRAEPAFQHDLRPVLERVGHEPGIAGRYGMHAVLDLEHVIEGAGTLVDRPVDD